MNHRHTIGLRFFVFVLAALAGGLLNVALADAPRVLPAGALPNDKRLGPLKDLDGYFPWSPSKTPEEWAKRGERVKRQLLVANGLWPMPAKAPLNAVVHGKVERDNYTVERVYFESYPGHFVSGSLYRPKGKSGKLPAVLCPHGHWPNGRFADMGDEPTRKAISEGAERFMVGGRYPLQARCVQLARMGCVVFHYDMMGNADSQQLSRDLVHGFAKQRPEMDTPEKWGFYGAQAELRQQSVMGVQTYNSIRALDWITSLPDVDPTRIGVTGASGGGTQTFILCAIDPRPTVAFPAVMVSTAMQGGCTCENCSHLRVGTGNIEICALIAPRPLGMTGADDWTKEIMTKGLPDLKLHYNMMGVPDFVMAKALTHFPHNYNFVSREVMYQWFNKHLKLGLPDPVVEEDYKPLSIAEMTVWDDKHPKPPAGDEYERSLCRLLAVESDKQMAALKPTDAASARKFREVVGGGIDVLVGRGLPLAGAVTFEQVRQRELGNHQELAGLVSYKAQGEELPVVVLQPKKWNRQVVIWIHEDGKNGLYSSDGSPSAEVRRLLDAGTAVVGADLFEQGEFLADGKPRTVARRVDNPREFAGYTYGYNSTVFAQRAQDILSLVSYWRNRPENKAEKVQLVALEGAGPWAAAALAQAGSAVDRAAIDTAGFRFAKLKSLGDMNFLPGAVKYGDVPGMLAVAAPVELWLAGEGAQAPELVQAAYKAAGAAAKLHTMEVPGDKKAEKAVAWLLK